MNSFIFDIIDDIQLGKQIKYEVVSLLNWCCLQDNRSVSIYSLQHDSFKCIFSSINSPPEQYYCYIENWNPSFLSEGITLRPVLKACINSMTPNTQVYYISNNSCRWAPDLSNRCKPYFVKSAPAGYFIQNSVTQLFKEIVAVVFPFRLLGCVIVSNEGKCLLGKSFEISIQASPVLMPMYKISETRLELYLEGVVALESILVQYVYGENWIISSVSSDFLAICEAFNLKQCAMICSSGFDLDLGTDSQVPLFYALFPAIQTPTTFLMRKIANKEIIRHVDLPPVCLDHRPQEIPDFIFENFNVEKYNPDSLESGIQQYLSAVLSQNSIKNPKTIPSTDIKSKKTHINVLDSIANSICKKKTRKS